jgi:predicted permease
VVKCNGQPFTVIGVLPATFRFSEKGDIWFTEPITKFLKDTGSNYMMIARLRDGLSMTQAQERLAQLSEVFAKTYPQSLWSDRPGQTAIIQSYAEMMHQDSRAEILLLFGAVVLVLLIASANVAGLMVARSVGRGREVAIRSAVGASRSRLFAQLIIESIVLNLLGGAAGVTLALWGMQIVNATIATRFPEAGAIQFDGFVLAFAVAASMIAGAVSGILPAWHVARGDTFAWMKHGTASRGQRRSRKMLIAAEVALALVLLSGSALLLRSFARLRAVDPGFNMANLYAVELSLGQQKYQATANAARFTHDVVERLNAIPGLQATAEAAVPLRRGLNLGFRGGKCDTGGIQFRAVTPEFFAVMGIPLRQGRAFTEGESAPIAVLNEKLAKTCWPSGDALGASLVAERNVPPRQVIGIVGTTREYGLAGRETSVVYVPVWQVSDRMMRYNNGIFNWSIVVRTSGQVDVSSLARRAVRQTDPEQAIIDVVAVAQLAGDSVSDERMIASVMSSFGFAALLLTVVGLYALLAYYVAERTREIGIRMALGAAHVQVVGMVLREGMALVAIGSVVGIIAAVLSARALSHQIAGLGTVDPWAMAAAVLLLATAALLASWLPARRAARVDPMVALRYE